jgi:phosphoribosyl-AMP cyclohydrolase
LSPYEPRDENSVAFFRHRATFVPMSATFPARTTTADIELGATLRPKFGPDGLIPCITQDASTGEVLMFAFMNAESLAATLATRKATYWSRSRQKLWVKGEESGNVQLVRELLTDCDQDVLLLKVEQSGPVNASCHNGYKSCFYRRLASLDDPARSLTFTAKPLFDPATVYKKKA